MKLEFNRTGNDGRYRVEVETDWTNGNIKLSIGSAYHGEIKMHDHNVDEALLLDVCSALAPILERRERQRRAKP